VKRALAIAVIISSSAVGQIPRALAVDPALNSDAANDFFLRGKNIYDSAQASTTYDTRIAYFQQSVQIFNEYLTAFPNHPNAEMAWWYLGNSYYLSGQIDDGKRCFSTLLNRYVKGKWAAAAAYTLAADYYNKGDYAFAAPMFERFAVNAGKPEERPRGNYLAGNCYRLLGRDREATGLFNKVIDDPAGGIFIPQSKVALGNILLKSGKREEALKRFEEVIGGPYSPKICGEAALSAALIATKLGQTTSANKYLQLILHTDGMEEFRPDAQTALMGLFFTQKEYRKVVDLFASSQTKASGEKEADRLLIAGRAYMRLQLPSDAIPLFRGAEQLLKPESEAAFQASYYRLLCFYDLKGSHLPDQVDAFLQIYRKSRPEDQRIHTALMMKAESLFAKKEIAAAAAVYNEINANKVSEKNRPGLLYQRGWCLSEAGDAQGTIRSLNEFVTKYPSDARIPNAIAKRAKAYAETAELAKAIADYDRLTADHMPDDLASFAWLESARLRRTANNIPDMILRYQGLLGHVKNLTENLQAEANYWIGWGMVKSNTAKDAIPYLEKARTLRPDAYRKHAGLLLSLGYFASQDQKKLSEEIDLAIEWNYESDIPNQAIQWSGMQSYNMGDYKVAAKTLALVSNPAEPRETPKEVWRYLAKSRLEIDDPDGALLAANHVLEVEDNSGWKADALLDRGRALLALKRTEDAQKSANEALALHPQGHTSAGLNILVGDLEMKSGDLKTAAGKYLIVVEFHDDKDLKPLALWKLIQVLDQQSDQAEAAKYRQKLTTEFPAWKPPGGSTI